MTKKTTRKKPLQCKICGKKFSYAAKEHPLARINKHRWKEHPTQAKRSMKKGQKKRVSKLDKELMYTDDMIMESLQRAGIPIQQPRYQPIPQIPIEHEQLVGAILTGIALASAGAKLAKDIREVPPSRKKKK